MDKMQTISQLLARVDGALEDCATTEASSRPPSGGSERPRTIQQQPPPTGQIESRGRLPTAGGPSTEGAEGQGTQAGQATFLSSQINGGGCLAPPTPGERSSNVLGLALQSYFGPDSRSNFERYKGDLPKSLAWRTSAQQMVRRQTRAPRLTPRCACVRAQRCHVGALTPIVAPLCSRCQAWVRTSIRRARACRRSLRWASSCAMGGGSGSTAPGATAIH